MRGQSADGGTWSVRRRWLPWRRRTKRPDWLDSVDGADLASGADDLVGFVLLLVFGLVAIPALILMIFFGAEFLLLLLLLPFVTLARVAFGLPWTIEVRTNGNVVAEHRAKGWRGSANMIETLAEQMRSGAGGR